MTIRDLIERATDAKAERLIRAAYDLGAAEAMKKPPAPRNPTDLAFLKNQAD